jgi:preprotein translocase subunit SecB
MPEEVEQPALDEFALHNAPWHIWPYWREYVANQCARLNIPKATMPMQRLAPRQDAPESSPNP